LVLVVGARNSSNSNRLKEVALSQGTPAHLIQDESEMDPKWLEGVHRIGISSGASTPEVLVQGLIAALSKRRMHKIEVLPGVEEDVVFRLPTELA